MRQQLHHGMNIGFCFGELVISLFYNRTNQPRCHREVLGSAGCLYEKGNVWHFPAKRDFVRDSSVAAPATILYGFLKTVNQPLAI